jgi:hypothetical protein
MSLVRNRIRDLVDPLIGCRRQRYGSQIPNDQYVTKKTGRRV